MYERAFENIAPALLQTRSVREPSARVHGFDYRHFAAYEIAEGEMPTYLEQDYGLKINHAMNIQKIIRGDLKFEDSKNSIGIQVADLLSSGLRKCLRGQFSDNESIARALGRLTLQKMHNTPPIHLVSFAGIETEADKTASDAVKLMIRVSRPMIAKTTRS